MNTVYDLLKAAGFAPRMDIAGFNAAVWLADAVRQTITSPIKRATFVAAAAAYIAEMDYHAFEGLESQIQGLAEAAEAARPTPCGAVEIWGNLLQLVQPEMPGSMESCAVA